MPDRLESLLDTKAARIGLLAGRVRLALRPVGEPAGTEATHASDLVAADLLCIMRRHEDQRRIGRAQGFAKARSDPALGRFPVVRCQVNYVTAGTDTKRRGVLADRLDRVGDLARRPLLQFVEKRIMHRRRIEAGRAEAVERNISLVTSAACASRPPK